MEENLSEVVEKHTSWTTGREYVIDSPEYTEWICTECGEKRDSEP